MLRFLISHVRARHLVLPAAVYLPSAVLMFARPDGALAAVSRACRGLAPFDTRGWWTLHDAVAMQAACGAAGRAAYIHQQLLDLVYPAALAAVLLAATALLVKPYGSRWWPILLPTLAMTVCDYTENVGVWTLLLDWGHTHPAVIAVTGSATLAKRVLGTVAYTIPLVLAAVRTSSALQRRRRRPAPDTNRSGVVAHRHGVAVLDRLRVAPARSATDRRSSGPDHIAGPDGTPAHTTSDSAGTAAGVRTT